MMAGAHAFCAPSTASRWKVCALSAALERAYPADESEESREGTAAHWVVEQCIKGMPPTLRQLAPNGVAVTDEMMDGAQLVVETLHRHLGPHWQSMIMVEQRVQIARIHREHCWGTPDYFAWARMPDGRFALFVFDYKFGHDPVEVFENDQLVTYTAGILGQSPNIDDQLVIVTMVIIQPRSSHRDGSVRSWRVLASDLRGQINKLAMAAEAATRPDALATPDPDACANCSARAHCEAAQKGAWVAAARAQRSIPHDLSPHALGLELHYLERAQGMLEARVKGLQAQAEAMLTSGQTVPFYRMGNKASRLKWKYAPEAVIGLGMMSGKDLRAPVDVITPTQARDRKLMSEADLKLYAEKVSAGVKLERDDGSKARLHFGYTPV